MTERSRRFFPFSRVAAALALAAALGALLASGARAGVWTQISTPNPQLTALAESDSGTIYFATLSPPGTPNGADVWEFDGLAVRSLPSRYSPAPAFGSSIRALAVAPNGDLWVGTDVGAFRLGAHDFRQFTKEDGLGSRLVSSINDLLVAPDGTVWAATKGGGLSRYDGSTWTSLRDPEDGLPSNDVQGLALGADGTLWIAMNDAPSGKGLARYQGGVITPVVAAPPALTRLTVAADGRVWAVEASAGAFVFDAAGNLVAQYGLPSITNDLSSVVEGPHGDLWLGSFTDGVYRFDGGGWEQHSARLGSGLANDTIRDLLVDGAGVLWVATAGGLFRYEGSLWLSFTPSHFPAMLGARINGLSRGPASDLGSPPASGTTRGPVYAALGAVPAGNPGGLVRVAGLEVESVLDTLGSPLSGAFQAVSAVTGGAWAARGMEILRIQGAATTQVYGAADTKNDVFSLLGRADGTAWAGTRKELLHFQDGAWTAFDVPGLVPSKILSLAEDGNGKIWAASETNGAARIDPVSGTIERFTTAQGLPSNNLFQVYVTPSGDVWFATAGGAARLRGAAIDSVLTAAGGLPSNVVLSVGQDQAGELWLGTTNGLAYLSGSALAAYGTADGLPSSVVTTLLADTSQALLGSDSNGLALFHRDRVPPRVRLVDLPDSVTSTRAARIDFDGADLGSQSAPRFSWSLDGSSATPFTSDKTARLFGLGDGRHVFQVWGRDRALNVTPIPQQISFEVDATPPQPVLASPSFGTVVRGVTPVVARIDEPRFERWEVQVRPAGDDDPVRNPWTTLGRDSVPPAPEDTLVYWNTSGLPDGDFELRVSVTDKLGLIGYAQVSVTVDNLSPGNSITSPAEVNNTTGGRVFTLNAEVEVYFPPRALDSDRTVSIDTVATPVPLPPGASSLAAVWRVQPLDFVTHKPVTLTFDERFFAPEANPTLAPASASAVAAPVASMRAVFALSPGGGYTYLGGTETGGKLATTAGRLGVFVVARGLFAGLTAGGRDLDVQPRAFSPDGSTFDDRAAISFQLSDGGSTRVFVYDRAGRLVRRVFDGPLGSGRNVVYWDGKDGGGDEVPTGVYLVAVEAEGKTDVRSVAVVNR